MAFYNLKKYFGLSILLSALIFSPILGAKNTHDKHYKYKHHKHKYKHHKNKHKQVYKVGFVQAWAFDGSREILPGEGGERTIEMRIWYPTKDTSGPKTLGSDVYLTQFPNARAGLEEWVLQDVNDFDTFDVSQLSSDDQEQLYSNLADLMVSTEHGSYLNAAMASGGPFPVVVMRTLNGWNSHTDVKSGELLARNGYIAIAVGNVGNSRDVIIPDIANTEASKITGLTTRGFEPPDYSPAVIALDLLVVIDEVLPILNEGVDTTSGPIRNLTEAGKLDGVDFTGKIQVNNVGLLGSSEGDIAADMAVHESSNIQAVMGNGAPLANRLFEVITIPDFPLPSILGNGEGSLVPKVPILKLHFAEDTSPLFQYFNDWLPFGVDLGQLYGDVLDFGNTMAWIGFDLGFSEDMRSPLHDAQFVDSECGALRIDIARAGHSSNVESGRRFEYGADVIYDANGNLISAVTNGLSQAGQTYLTSNLTASLRPGAFDSFISSNAETWFSDIFPSFDPNNPAAPVYKHISLEETRKIRDHYLLNFMDFTLKNSRQARRELRDKKAFKVSKIRTKDMLFKDTGAYMNKVVAGICRAP